MTYLKILARLFKAWFLPAPAHDFEEPVSQKKPPAPPAEAAPPPDGQPFVHDENSEAPAPTGAAPLNPVAPPEGAEERASRTSTRTNPPPAE